MDFSSVPRALQSLERRVPSVQSLVAPLRSTGATADTWLTQLPALVAAEPEKWECLAVSLYCATQWLQQQQAQEPQVYMEGPRVPSAADKTDSTPTNLLPATPLTAEQRQTLCTWCHEQSLQHLEHSEPRIRTLVAKAVAVYARDDQDAETYLTPLVQGLQTQLTESIRQHILQGRDTSNPQHSKDSTGALDDTTGWRALETNWQTLAALVTARGSRVFAAKDDEGSIATWNQLLLDAQYSAVTHVNRHVRAASMAFLEQCVHAVAADYATHGNKLTTTTDPLHKCLAAVLKTGLADNWSQVRMAASVLVRVLFVTVQEQEQVQENQPHPLAPLFPTLLPRMCLNRFYLAQGVKLYSHETWRLVMQTHGMARVVQHLPAVTRYYVQAADADNHVVREAACQAMAELAVRLTVVPEYAAQLLPHVPTLLQALLMCFYDESWPVRDEACLATALLCKSFPDACRPELPTLWERWSEQLTDQIWSVRQDAAVALGDALEAFPDELWPKVQKLLTDLLPSAREQPAMTREAYKQHQNDINAHSNSTLYSCGSLAPKLSKKSGAGRIGCSSCGVDRDKAPWEATDGCLYLIRELVLRCETVDGNQPEGAVPPLAKLHLADDDYFVPLMQQVVDICRVKHFPQSDDLRATLWRQLPVMAEAWGKEKFKKKYLHIFTELLMDHLDMRTATPLSKHAAGQCADLLANLVGRGIFRGRLEDWQQDIFDRAMRERANLPPGPNDEFSPYGPPGLLDNVGGNLSPPAMNPGRAF